MKYRLVSYSLLSSMRFVQQICTQLSACRVLLKFTLYLTLDPFNSSVRRLHGLRLDYGPAFAMTIDSSARQALTHNPSKTEIHDFCLATAKWFSSAIAFRTSLKCAIAFQCLPAIVKQYLWVIDDAMHATQMITLVFLFLLMQGCWIGDWEMFLQGATGEGRLRASAQRVLLQSRQDLVGFSHMRNSQAAHFWNVVLDC